MVIVMQTGKWKIYWNDYLFKAYLFGTKITFHSREDVEIENEFIKEIVYGTFTYKDELDKLANKYMKDWTIDRLGFTDIAILRMAIYELIYSDTPDIVVINEAVELAKSYSDDKVVKLINGVLDKIYHEEVNE